MKNQRFSIRKRLGSFRYAWNGLRILLKEEHNARIHLVAACLVVAAGFYFDVSRNEWLALVFAIGFVFSLELLNSAIENIADFISPEKHEQIKRIKDLAAGAVLFAAITAVMIGLLIFVPKLIELG